MRCLVLVLAILGLPAASKTFQPYPVTDADGDQTISRAEYLDVVDALFARADTNFDGFIDSEEVPALRRLAGDMDQSRRFRLADVDGDGLMSQEEMFVAKERREQTRAAERREALAPFDTDGNGRLDETERRARTESWASERKSRSTAMEAHPNAQNRPDVAGDGGGVALISVADLLDSSRRVPMDGDADDRVTLMEYRAYMEQRFDTKDSDKDGVLMGDETLVDYLFMR